MNLSRLREWWWRGRPGVLQSMGSQRVGHDWATELNWTELCVCVDLYSWKINNWYLNHCNYNVDWKWTGLWLHFLLIVPSHRASATWRRVSNGFFLPLTSGLKWSHRLVSYFTPHLPFSITFVSFCTLLEINFIFFKKPMKVFSFSFILKYTILKYSHYINCWKI